MKVKSKHNANSREELKLMEVPKLIVKNVEGKISLVKCLRVFTGCMII